MLLLICSIFVVFKNLVRLVSVNSRKSQNQTKRKTKEDKATHQTKPPSGNATFPHHSMTTIDRNSPGAVFVGNISYDTTQEQLRAIMQEVGPIKCIKLVLNRETGQHRGYGFVEYHSLAVAKSAMQNLAGRELMGRKIRVDSASQNAANANKSKDSGKRKGRGNNDNNNYNNNNSNSSNNNGGNGGEFGGGDFGGGTAHPSQRRHQRQQPHQAAAGPSQHEAVRSALQQLSVYQIYDVLKQMKVLCQERPQIAETILLSRPPLAQALLQAQHMFGMVHETVDGLELPTTEKTDVSNRSARSASSQRAPLPPQSSLDRGGKTGRSKFQAPVTVPTGHPPLLSAVPSHSLPPQSAQMAPPQMAPPGTRLIQGFDDPVPEHLIQQALGLTPDQISGLTPEQQQSIGMIRSSVQQQQQYGAPQMAYNPYNRR